MYCLSYTTLLPISPLFFKDILNYLYLEKFKSPNVTDVGAPEEVYRRIISFSELSLLVLPAK